MFQSTPDLVNRENLGGGTPEGLWSVFQSTPDLVNRENVNAALANVDVTQVSIHSRFS